MPNATVRANAQAMPIDRRLFLASGTAAAVFGALHAAIARAEATPILPAKTFDPAAYVAMWERRGNVVYWEIDASGRETLAIHLPPKGTWPGFAEINRLDVGSESPAEKARKVVAYLKWRGKSADRPLIQGAAR